MKLEDKKRRYLELVRQPDSEKNPDNQLEYETLQTELYQAGVDLEELEHIDLHNRIGCVGCRYADPETVCKTACCTHVNGPDISNESDRCMRARYPVPQRDGSTIYVSVPD